MRLALVMDYLFLIFILILLSATQSFKSKSPTGIGSSATTWENGSETQSDYDPNTWNIKLDINFSETLPNQRKPIKADIKVKYEVNIKVIGADHLITEEDAEETFKNFPIDNIMRSIKKNIDTHLLKGNQNDIRKEDISENLNVNPDEAACRNIINKGKNDLVDADIDVSTHHDIQEIFEKIEEAQEKTLLGEQIVPDAVTFPSPEITTATEELLTSPNKWKRPCQLYTGNACNSLEGRYVFIPHNTTLFAEELKAKKILQDTNHCLMKYTESYLCYSIFPLCKDPLQTYNSFEELVLEKRIKYSKLKGYTTRICKEDCEEFEKGICQEASDMIKIHFGFEHQDICKDLPIDDDDCIALGLPHLTSYHTCVYGDGNDHEYEYKGRVRTSISHLPCLRWSEQSLVNVSEYPYLEKQRNYCRNPGGIMSRPWCVVDNGGVQEVQICNIRECSFFESFHLD